MTNLWIARDGQELNEFGFVRSKKFFRTISSRTTKHWYVVSEGKKSSSISQHYCQHHSCVAIVIEGRFYIPTLTSSVHLATFQRRINTWSLSKHFKRGATPSGWREPRRDTHLVPKDESKASQSSTQEAQHKNLTTKSKAFRVNHGNLGLKLLWFARSTYCTKNCENFTSNRRTSPKRGVNFKKFERIKGVSTPGSHEWILKCTTTMAGKVGQNAGLKI